MKRLLILVVTLCAGVLCAQEPEQTRTQMLDQAYEEVRAAATALKAAEAKRESGEEPQPGERTGTVSGFSRLNDAYFARQQAIEQEIAAARSRYETAVKRWNELK